MNRLLDVSMVSPLAGEDLLLCALFGGIISGVGSGLTIRDGRLFQRTKKHHLFCRQPLPDRQDAQHYPRHRP